MKYSSVNIITFGKKKQNLLLALDNLTIGSFLTTFDQHVDKDSIVLLHCCSVIWGAARISSEYYYSEEVIWADKKYPHRFKISQIQLLKEPIHLSNGVYNRTLRDEYGVGWAYKFLFSPKALPENIASELLRELSTNTSIDFLEFRNVLENFNIKKR